MSLMMEMEGFGIIWKFKILRDLQLVAYATGGLSLIPSIIGAIGGQIFTEGAEEIVEDSRAAVLPAYRGIQFMLSLRNAADKVGYSKSG